MKPCLPPIGPLTRTLDGAIGLAECWRLGQRFALLLLALLATRAGPSWAQAAAIGGQCRVVIHGDVTQPGTYGPAELARLPRRTVTVADHGQLPAAYSGVRLADLLALAGVNLGPLPRGGGVTQYVVARASDGYRALYSVAELDSALTGADVLLVDAKDGRPLEPAEGPCRIVVPGDHRQARWVRQVTTIEFHQVP